VKALALGSKEKHLVEPFKALLNMGLEQIFEQHNVDNKPEENLKRTKGIMEQLFVQMNTAARVGMG